MHLLHATILLHATYSACSFPAPYSVFIEKINYFEVMWKTCELFCCWYEYCIKSVWWFRGSAGSDVDTSFVFPHNLLQKIIFMKFHLK